MEVLRKRKQTQTLKSVWNFTWSSGFQRPMCQNCCMFFFYHILINPKSSHDDSQGTCLGTFDSLVEAEVHTSKELSPVSITNTTPQFLTGDGNATNLTYETCWTYKGLIPVDQGINFEKPSWLQDSCRIYQKILKAWIFPTTILLKIWAINVSSFIQLQGLPWLWTEIITESLLQMAAPEAFTVVGALTFFGSSQSRTTGPTSAKGWAVGQISGMYQIQITMSRVIPLKHWL